MNKSIFIKESIINKDNVTETKERIEFLYQPFSFKFVIEKVTIIDSNDLTDNLLTIFNQIFTIEEDGERVVENKYIKRISRLLSSLNMGKEEKETLRKQINQIYKNSKIAYFDLRGIHNEESVVNFIVKESIVSDTKVVIVTNKLFSINKVISKCKLQYSNIMYTPDISKYYPLDDLEKNIYVTFSCKRRYFNVKGELINHTL